MTPISSRFGGRRRDDVDPSRIPPGQNYERDFPVLSRLLLRGNTSSAATARLDHVDMGDLAKRQAADDFLMTWRKTGPRAEAASSICLA
jgi:hypothetical protein